MIILFVELNMYIVVGGGLCKLYLSGVVFFYVCVCGCFRKLRKDFFDFESVNVIFF